ncbi:MAG TPA: glycosyltransferase family 9 protein [Pyrinomonadaceae bacterium]|nr:glycosyltransferase family 9 protein [Pyrinomonadaceae bacterium]
MAIPALRAVRRHFAGSELVMLQNFTEEGLVLASEVVPPDLIDRTMVYKVRRGRASRAAGFLRLWHELRRERFDAAVYLVMSERPANDVRRDRLFFRSAGIKRLYGFHPIAPDELYPVDPEGRPTASKHEAIFRLERLAHDGIEFRDEDLDTPMIEPGEKDLAQVDRWLSDVRKRPNVSLVSIGPGCKQPVNEWPLANFSEIGRRLAAMDVEIVVVGGKAEKEMGDRLIAEWGTGINAAGIFPVRLSAALLSRCSIHIGLDTGTTHLAAAAGTRCLAIFGGRNSPGAWYPLGDGHTIIHHPVPCAPCRAFTCLVPGHPCMTEIGVETVWNHLSAFIDGDRRTSDKKVQVVSV